MLQATALNELRKWCQSNNLSVITFTGYTLDELKLLDYPKSMELFNNSDVVIDGEYDERQFSASRGWIGSDNQKIYYNTDKYNSTIENTCISVEISITSNDELIINGWPLIDLQKHQTL